MNVEYIQARKLGMKAYKEALNAGKYPYLRSLSEMISQDSIIAETNLGLMDIPMDRIDGTYTAGRRGAFAPNFMPLLDIKTEFESKWTILCEAHMTEGIREPVTAFEYMNKYYIGEGNKRVSVLKFAGADCVPGYVKRLIPARDNTPENRLYFEYLEFYRNCPENYMIFSHLGDYKEFLELIEVAPDHVWKPDELLDLHSVYTRFESACRSRTPRPENLNIADAFLSYLHFYSYKDAVQKVPSELAVDLARIWDEIELTAKPEQVSLLMDSEEPQKKNLFVRMFADSVPDRKLRVAFVYAKDPTSSAWTYGHELGRMHLDDVFGDNLETFVRENVDPVTQIDGVLDELAECGMDIIFATTPVFLGACLKAAARHPGVRILNCAVNSAHRYIRTYYARMYEAKFLSGLIAGAMTENDEIGYLTDYPIFANIASLNAFARGVEMVNPRARVHVQWSSVEGADPAAYFNENNVKIISGRELVMLNDESREFGLYRLTENGRENLALPLFDWGVLYQKLIESILNGNWTDVDRASGKRALNYWWGISSGAIDLLCSRHVPESVLRLVNLLKNQIRLGTYAPFDGRIITQNGCLSEDETSSLSPKEIATMSWLNSNIIGSIPEVSALTAEGRAIMTVQGIQKKDAGDAE